ncbi:phage tail protein [Flavitalea sp.]|nr:phage tail protein [Flavitalea sp.]
MEKRKSQDEFYQLPGFHFRVCFSPDDTESFDTRFQSVTGLDSTIETETVKEGGENRFEHVIPVRRKYGPLILKRGVLLSSESGVTKWLNLAFQDQIVIPIGIVDIQLLDEEHNPLLQWTVNNVWPRSWKIGELNAERGEVLIETLELNYNYISFVNR